MIHSNTERPGHARRPLYRGGR